MHRTTTSSAHTRAHAHLSLAHILRSHKHAGRAHRDTHRHATTRTGQAVCPAGAVCNSGSKSGCECGGSGVARLLLCSWIACRPCWSVLGVLHRVHTLRCWVLLVSVCFLLCVYVMCHPPSLSTAHLGHRLKPRVVVTTSEWGHAPSPPLVYFLFTTFCVQVLSAVQFLP